MNEYERLALAIVEQAVDDYRSVLMGKPLYSIDKYITVGGVWVKRKAADIIEERKKSCERSKKELERFFRSKWFATLVDVDGERIMKQIQDQCKLQRIARYRT